MNLLNANNLSRIVNSVVVLLITSMTVHLSTFKTLPYMKYDFTILI